MSFLRQVNTVISVLFFACYFYQLIYLLVPYLRRDKPHGETKLHRFAVLVAARNEEAVIGQLIASVKAQDYPARLITVFVAADNCTDATARIARESGAVVYERFDTAHVGKGYALDFLLRQIAGEYGDVFDAYLVLDADNLLSPEYVTAMNRVFSDGYPVVTSYRNSKNFADNWISAGYALWFLREAEFLNHARVLSGHSAAVSGTGFLFSREILRRNGGWPFHLLTEDIEFTVDCVCRGEKIGYAPDAVLYDEQPTTLRQSWRQRERWARGYMQVYGRYGGRLSRAAAGGSFSAFDMAMCIMPALILSIARLAVAAAQILLFGSLRAALLLLPELFTGPYLFLLFIGGVTTLSQWRNIKTTTGKKLLYTLTFPLFMFTYVPITVTAMLHNVEWKPIDHKRAMTISEIGLAGKP